MALLRCPTCQRVWDGDVCLACGHQGVSSCPRCTRPWDGERCHDCGHAQGGEPPRVPQAAAVPIEVAQGATSVPAAPISLDAEAGVDAGLDAGFDVDLDVDIEDDAPLRAPAPTPLASQGTAAPLPSGAPLPASADLESSFFAVEEPSSLGGGVIEDLTDGELLLAQKDFQTKLAFIAEIFVVDGRFTESLVVEEAAQVLRNASAALLGIAELPNGLGARLKDGNEKIVDESNVIDDMEIGELLAVKSKLSAKVDILADFIAREGRIAESQVLRHAASLLKRLDAMCG